MKTRILLFFAFFAFNIQQNFGQVNSFSCSHENSIPLIKNGDSAKGGGTVLSASPCEDDEISFLKINVHFMHLRGEDGPGNFTETDDGLGNAEWNGCKYAETLTKHINDNWARNYQMIRYPGSNDLPPAAPPEFLAKRIQFVLKEIHYHTVGPEEYYVTSNSNPNFSLIQKYGKNLGSEINIFMLEHATSTHRGGRAYSGSGGLGAILYNAWLQYQTNPNPNSSAYDMARLTGHEFGHMFGLNHSFCGANGCPDIDIEQESCGNNCWPCWDSGSNNLMGYVQSAGALTPCQLDVVHNKLLTLTSYIDSCCDDWETQDIECATCNFGDPLPGIKMVTECSKPACKDFEIERTNFGQNDGNCQFEFKLKGNQEQLDCNKWEITIKNFVSDQVYDSYTYTNLSSLVWHTNQWRTIEICVTACGGECTEFTKCISSDCVYPFTGDNGSEFTIPDNEGNNNFSNIAVFPNPFQNQLEIQVPDVDLKLTAIYDNLGRLIQAIDMKDEKSKTINTFTFAPGIYWIKLIKNDDSFQSQKFVKTENF